VLVGVAAAGVCYHDVLVMRGVLRRGVKPGIVLGHEFAGEVVECGDLVSSVSPGDQVVSILTDACGACVRCAQGREHRCLHGSGIGHGADGAFAEYVRVSAASLVTLPVGADPATACLYGCPMGVALHSLDEAARLRPGETVVVTGAGGGLGVHTVQIARALGAKVFAITTSEEKEGRLRDLGAHEVIVAPDLDFGEIVLAMTEDMGAEVVVNTLGAIAFESCWTAMGQYGRMVLVGDIRGGEVSLSPAELLFKDASLIGVSGVSRQQVRAVANMVAADLVRPIVSQTFSLEDASEAYALMRQKGSFGRLTLTPS
jgi:D-arabinose 1-dehydrogenase-like Zn-dependent alcohol dehydrogenase